jgi:hypothetical protein
MKERGEGVDRENSVGMYEGRGMSGICEGRGWHEPGRQREGWGGGAD